MIGFYAATRLARSAAFRTIRAGVQGGAVQGVQQIEADGRLRQLVAEEVSGRGSFARPEVADSPPRVPARARAKRPPRAQPPPDTHSHWPAQRPGPRQRGRGGSDPVPRCDQGARVGAAWPPTASARAAVSAMPPSSSPRAAPPSATTLRPSRSKPWIPWVPSWSRVQPVVPVELLHIIIPGVAVAAMHLNCQRVRLQTPLRRPTLGDGGEHVQQRTCLLPVTTRRMR